MIEHISPRDNSWIDKPIKGFYQIVHGGNGEFIHAKRAGLHAIIRMSNICERWCLNVHPLVELDKRISNLSMGIIYDDFLRSLPNERLVWLTLDRLIFPAQTTSPGRVNAIDPFHPDIRDVVFDVHSHNTMSAYFSSQDDKDESKGFRIYVVIGRVGSEMPQIRARIGCFGNFMNVPIQTVADLPEGLNFEDLHEA